jgi:hypothetical protein
MSANGFPGKRVEDIRAGMMTVKVMDDLIEE